MPEENKKASEELIDVGETEGAEINFDSKGEPEKQEVVPEETIEVEKTDNNFCCFSFSAPAPH